MITTIDLEIGGTATWDGEEITLDTDTLTREEVAQVARLCGLLPPAPATESPENPPDEIHYSEDSVQATLEPDAVNIDCQDVSYEAFDRMCAWIQANRPFVEVRE